MRPYNIFMAVIDRIGHASEETLVFKRDEYGDEIWELNDGMSGDSTMQITMVLLCSKDSGKQAPDLIDDQTYEVPAVFDRWKHQEGIPW